MENKINNSFINNTNDYMNSTINILNVSLNEEGTLKENRRMVYKNGKELQSVNYTLVYSVDTGKFFKETIGFEIYIDEEIDFILIVEQFTNNKKTLSKNDFIKTSEFIINKIIKKRTNDNNLLKKIK